MGPLCTRTLVILLAWGLGVAWPIQGQSPRSSGSGNLLVAPTRVVFEGRKRVAEVSLTNAGQARATYRISLVRMEMDEMGGVQDRPLDPSSENLQSLFRFSPREVTLEPQESQTVRIQVRKPADLPAGEYRLHMLFRAVPPPPDSAPPPPETSQGLSIKLTALFGVAIPLIVRQGETSAQVSIAEPVLDLATRTLQFRLNRSGNQSIFGDVHASLVSARGAPETLAEAAGLAVYPPNGSRRVTLALLPARALPSGSRIQITFTLPPQDGGVQLAETYLTVP
jgi:P pilus assembly chaperone PapD